MSSAWGDSWGGSWGASWGGLAEDRREVVRLNSRCAVVVELQSRIWM